VVQVEVKLTGVDGVLDLLKSLPREVVSKRGGPVKTAARKGLAKIYKPAKQNLLIVTQGEDSTGLLAKNLILTRGKPPTSGNGERYIIRVRRKSYQRNGKPVTTLKTAHLLEYGSVQQPAEPWLRPAFNANARAAIDETTKVLLAEIDKVVKRLGKR